MRESSKRKARRKVKKEEENNSSGLCGAIHSQFDLAAAQFKKRVADEDDHQTVSQV
jgi:hypothetical protein